MKSTLVKTEIILALLFSLPFSLSLVRLRVKIDFFFPRKIEI